MCGGGVFPFTPPKASDFPRGVADYDGRKWGYLMGIDWGEENGFSGGFQKYA
jgi:hypothetical protein